MLKALDLFCGLGGWSDGLAMEGFKMIIRTTVDYETGDTTVLLDLGDKTFRLKVNLQEIRDKVDAASSNIWLQKATELIAHALGVDIQIQTKMEKAKSGSTNKIG